MPPHRSDSLEAQDNIRKRVCKACDRCRLKKSKCDGASPCSRCKADNAICVFGERKKSQDKVYPKGYVEMLEQQQSQLVAGIRELYSKLRNGEPWPGKALKEAPGGHPLTHDILERLDLLHSSAENGGNYEGFEEDCNRMQQKLLERGAPYTHRRGSISSNSDHGRNSSSSSYHGTPVTQTFAFENPFARNTAPPTPPMNSPFPRQSQVVSPVKAESPIVSSTFMYSGALDTAAFSRQPWMNEPMMIDDSADMNKTMYGFDNFNAFDQDVMAGTLGFSNPDPMMPVWGSANEVDFGNFVQHPVTS